eukprot:scaffold5213_cov113-Isochrysis_galbana.AAC.9
MGRADTTSPKSPKKAALIFYFSALCSHEEDMKTDTRHIQGAHKTTKGKGSTLIEDESVGDRFCGRRTRR